MPTQRTLRWPAYAAAIVAFAFAAVSLYWALGGTAGVATLGGTIEERARADDPTLTAVLWITVVLKLAGGLLALALVQPWGRVVPRRLLLIAAWAGAMLLTAYGAVQMLGVAVVKIGLVTPREPVGQSVLNWRLAVWEPWFLGWGLLLGLAAWQFGRQDTTAIAG